MTEKELQTYLKQQYPVENTCCDWKEMKNLKNSFASDERKDVISYLSGISNMEGGVLVIGVEDGTLNIVGTDLSRFNYDKNSVIYQMTVLCPNLPSEGLYVEDFITDDTSKVVWVIHIPKHLPRRPVYAHRKAWQRIGNSLVQLSQERQALILKEEIEYYDWSAEIISEATIDDLDPRAIDKALEGYCDHYPRRAEEAKQWTIETFLDKARVTINGKITRAALLLLGKEESVHYLNHPAEIVWKLQTGEERAAEIFYPPFLITAVALRSNIRNYQIKIFPSNALLPTLVMKYDQRSLLEALHNCILHQDYSLRERIVVTETADEVIFKNAGSFFEGQYIDYITGEKTPTKYRNPFLQTAMVNLNMVDSQGFGIRDMFNQQRSRYLPLPEYDTSSSEHVILTMPGHVLDVNYSTTLMENTTLPLDVVFLLDQVQRKKLINKDARKTLLRQKLIEGRGTNIHISKRVAKITHQEVEYTNMKGLDDKYYKELIIQALKDHKTLRRVDFNKLLEPKLPEVLTASQKKNRIDRLLRELRQSGKIKANPNKTWELV